MRRLLGIERRLPDTSARDILIQIVPLERRKALHRLVLAAHRRKALQPFGFPFGIVAMDDKYAQRNVHEEINLAMPVATMLPYQLKMRTFWRSNSPLLK